jgi:hypothetical protein
MRSRRVFPDQVKSRAIHVSALSGESFRFKRASFKKRAGINPI